MTQLQWCHLIVREWRAGAGWAETVIKIKICLLHLGSDSGARDASLLLYRHLVVLRRYCSLTRKPGWWHNYSQVEMSLPPPIFCDLKPLREMWESSAAGGARVHSLKIIYQAMADQNLQMREQLMHIINTALLMSTYRVTRRQIFNSSDRSSALCMSRWGLPALDTSCEKNKRDSCNNSPNIITQNSNCSLLRMDS